MEFTDAENPTKEEKKQAKDEVREEYLACLMLDG